MIIAIAIFAFKGCTARKKIITSEEEEYSAFINANIEFTCEMIKNPELKDNKKAQARLNEVYKKYKFPVEEDAEMMTVLKKYGENAEVGKIIKNNIAACFKGGNPIFYGTAE